MRSTIIRFGIYGAATICILFLLSWFLGKNLSYDWQQVLGYASMLISLTFVFFGIKHFRDRVNEGVVSFGKALILGLAITLITALAFGIVDLIYIVYINPDFTEEYFTYSIDQLRETLPAAEFEIQKAKMEAQKEFFTNPFMNFLVMAATVFIIGFIVSLLSAFILERN